MQGVTVDEENQPKSRNDEDFMNLRPSPNFKHKKYLRSKFEEAMMIEANSTSLGHNKYNKLEKVNVTMVASAAAQPPLPPNPPPPDTPPMIMNLKQEVEDDEYTSTTIEPITDFNQPEGAATATIKTDLSEKATMCRNFARGTCRKGTACRFVHELILSQLPGVYTFCRNFQNSMCSLPKCKFVHATVFEKEHFFRTGYLPPHTLAHLAEPSVLQPPPPPPQSEQASVEQPAEVAVEQPPVYSNAPPPPSSISCIESVVRYNTENSVERTEPNIFSTVQVTSTTSPKHDWSDVDDDTSSSSRDFDSSEALPRKCKNCPRTEIREQLLKNKIERRVRINKKMSQKIARLDKSNAILAAVLGAFFKPGQLGGTAGFNSPDKELMGLLPNSKLTAVLAKLLLNVEMPRPDSS